jgi:hypothetical protein
MASTKRLTEEEIETRLVGRPLSLVKGTFKNIKTVAEWKCLSNPIHGSFLAPPRQVIHANGNCPLCGKVGKLTEKIVRDRLADSPIELVAGTLKGSDKHAQWRCLSDDSHPVWMSAPSSVLNSKSGCPVCSGKNPLDEKTISSRLKGSDISLVSGSYLHRKRVATFECLRDKKHAHWTVSVKSILYQKTGCPECAGNIPLTEEIVKERLGSRPIELVVNSLKGSRGPSKWRCLSNEAHPVWMATAGSVLGGSNCPACTGHERLDPIVINRKIKSRPIKLLTENIEGSDKKVLWGCLTDLNHADWMATVGSVLAGSGCPECGGNAKLNEEKIAKRLEGRLLKLVKGTFKSSSDYAQWHCLSDKNHSDWQATVSSVLGGVGCPSCAEYGFKEGKPAHIYIMLIGDEISPIGIKCGITNNEPKFRHKQINRKTIEQVTLVKHWHHKSGKFIRKLEVSIAKKFKHNDLKNTLQDGKTETYFINDLEPIVKFIDEQFLLSDKD